MASIRKVKNKWLAEVRLKGLSTSKTFATKMEAQSWAVQKEQQNGKHGGIVKGKTFGDAIRQYALEISPKKKGARWEIIRLKNFERDPLCDILLTNLRLDDIQDWIDRRGKEVAAGSVNRETNLLSSVLRECRTTWKYMVENSFTDIKRPKNPPPRDRRISEAEISRILLALEYEEGCEIKTTRQHIAVAFLFALETAMRRGEIWGMTWNNVHLSERYVTLPETKNGTKRNVPLSTRAVELLEKIGNDKTDAVLKINSSSAETIFRGAIKLAGIKELTFHDTRHEAISRLARKLDVLDLARMVGHRDIRSLQIYYNATASEIAGRLG